MPHDSGLLDLLLELQALDRVPRMGYALRGVPEPESVTEHSFHVTFLVWLLARKTPGVDVLHAVELAMLHDLAEVRLGDLPRTAAHYLPDGAKNLAAERAGLDLLAPLGAAAPALLAEYESAATPEARLVKACDKLQLMLKVAVYEGWGAAGLAEFWEKPENFPDLSLGAVRELFEALRRRALGQPSASQASVAPPRAKQ